MSASLSWKTSRVGCEGSSKMRIVLHAKRGASKWQGGPLVPDGFEAMRRRTSASRTEPGAKRRIEYSISELASAHAMMRKLRRGEDLRFDKVASARQALEREDYSSALKVEIAVQRLLEDLGV